MFIVAKNPELLETDNVILGVLQSIGDGSNALNSMFCDIFEAPALENRNKSGYRDTKRCTPAIEGKHSKL